MYAKYWLVFKRGGERLTKPFATLEGLNNYIQGRRIEVIAKTKVVGEEYKKQIPKKPRENDAWAELTTEERLEDFQWHCRECHGHLEESWDHCAWCGQRLEW
jgi:hypothetical protein